jgi:hypothetical protein
MDPGLQKKLERAVSAASDRGIARGITAPFELFRFIAEALIDSRDPDIHAALQWLERQHRKDLN